MASVKQIPAEIAAVLNDEQKVAYKKMLMELERVQITLRFLTNKNEGALIYESHEWSGSVVGEFPKGIPPNTRDNPNVQVTFEHQGNNGISKAGVAYIASNQYWLVAWHVPANKIYVKVGPKAPINWDEIEKELDASKIGGSIFVDPQKGYTVAMSTIRDGKASAWFYDM